MVETLLSSPNVPSPDWHHVTVNGRPVCQCRMDVRHDAPACDFTSLEEAQATADSIVENHGYDRSVVVVIKGPCPVHVSDEITAALEAIGLKPYPNTSNGYGPEIDHSKYGHGRFAVSITHNPDTQMFSSIAYFVRSDTSRPFESTAGPTDTAREVATLSLYAL